VRLITGIDTAMPDVKRKWNYHAAWNQNDRLWRDDFRQLADCGFDLLRWQAPWSLVEPKQGEYRWDLIDPKVELATQLGIDIFYPIVHFNLPAWLARAGEKHAVFADQLPDRIAEYTDRLLTRYAFKLVIPVVEVQMDAFQRGRVGNWQPHGKSVAVYEAIYGRLVQAYKSAARVAKMHGATVVCSEPATEIQTVVDLSDVTDIAGIDLYPHMHQQRSILSFLRWWWQTAHLPLCISEFGTPETYNPATQVDDFNRFITAGVDDQRILTARLLADALRQAKEEGIPIPYGGWYPGTGNIGWGYSLTKDRKKADCDRAGLVDLARQPDGSLKRVLCRELVEEVLGLRNIYTPQAPAFLPMPDMPLVVSAATGD
jgi:Beta-galactosidase